GWLAATFYPCPGPSPWPPKGRRNEGPEHLNRFSHSSDPRSLDRADPSDRRLREEPSATTVGPDQSSKRRCRRLSCSLGCFGFLDACSSVAGGVLVRQPRLLPRVGGLRSYRRARSPLAFHPRARRPPGTPPWPRY